MYFNPSMILRTLFPGLIWNIPNNENKVFLTFDDGPDPEVTPWVLDLLNRYKAKATFFCLGKNVERYPDIFQRIKDEGHGVGNHSYSHLNGWGTKNNKYFEDIKRADKLIQSNLFRPPYGRIMPSQIRVLKEKYKIVMWDVMSGDYSEKINGEKSAGNVLKWSRPGSIIVFHDIQQVFKNLNIALPRILDGFRKRGLNFGAINQI
ncbi:Peptidoglycan-N-acetylglucosamine deacetylase [subsurface metagenome]